MSMNKPSEMILAESSDAADGWTYQLNLNTSQSHHRAIRLLTIPSLRPPRRAAP
ncbi:hypothetical protein J6590_035526, partial [Homalodisca vitripennis]